MLSQYSIFGYETQRVFPVTCLDISERFLYNLPNIKEILQHEYNAILFDPMEFNAFGKAVERVCSDSGLRERLGKTARVTISDCDYTWEQNAKQVESLIAELTKFTYR